MMHRINCLKTKKVIDWVHWAPVFITNNVIRETFGDYAKVKSIKHEVYTDAGLDGIATGVRKVLMVGDRHQLSCRNNDSYFR